jgi:pimeloyl-ACP methyl ester carboxylesterase
MVVRVGVEGARLTIDDTGQRSGRTVVLLHAGCADRRMWRYQLPALGEESRVLNVDRRGFGDSDDATTRFSHQDDLHGLMDALEVPSAVLVGCSDGGRIAIDAALARPDRIEALVLCAPGVSGYPWPHSMMSLYRERVHATIGAAKLAQYRAGRILPPDDADLDAYSTAETELLVAGPNRTRHHLRPDVWSLALDMDRRMNDRWWRHPPIPEEPPASPAWRRLSAIKTPTTVIIGEEDLEPIRQLARLVANAVDAATLVELPATGHLAPLERPADVAAAVRGALRMSHT